MQENPHNDRKLLIGVAAAVVAGVAAIALIAGVQEREAVTANASTAAAEPASRTVAPSDRVPPQAIDDFLAAVESRAAGSTGPAEPAEPAEDEPAFQIDPDADLEAEGRRAFARGAYDEAAAWFVAATDADGDDAMAHYLLGLSRWKAGDAANAEPSLARSAELNPASIRTWINLSRVRNDVGDYDAALDAARQALAIESDHAQALYLEGRSLRNLGRIDDAVASLERSFELDSENGHVANLLGLIAIERDEPAVAARHLERAAELAPAVAYIRNNLGVALERAGRADEAIAQFRKSVELDPGHAKAAASVARLEPLVGTPEPADPVATAVAEATQPVEPTETPVEDEGDAPTEPGR